MYMWVVGVCVGWLPQNSAKNHAFTNKSFSFVQDALQKQMRLFLDEVDQQVLLPTVRSYLKLYTTLPIRYARQNLGLSASFVAALA